MTVPFTFATSTSPIPLANLDANFAAVGDSTNITYTPPFTGGVAETLSAKLAQTVSVLDYGADPTGVLDSTSAINTAIANNGFVLIPFGTYRCDNSIVIQSSYTDQKFVAMQGATLKRVSSATSTDPVVKLIGSYGVFDAGGGFLVSEKNSPSGIVVLGHSDNTSSNYTAIYWEFKNAQIVGNITAINAGSATTFQSIGVYIPSSQPYLGSSSTNYFGVVQNVHTTGVTIGLWMTDLANGHTMYNYTVRGFSHYGILLQGSYGNSIYGGFMEVNYLDSKIGIGLRTKAYPSAPYASSLQSMYNQIAGYNMEFSGTAMEGLVIDSGCQANNVIFNWNATGTSIIDSDGFNNIIESRKQQFTEVSTNTITGVGQSAQSITIAPTLAGYAAGYGSVFDSSIGLYPTTDNAELLGTASKRWLGIYANSYYSSDGSQGASGTFTAGAKTVTVKDGLITSIV